LLQMQCKPGKPAGTASRTRDNGGSWIGDRVLDYWKRRSASCYHVTEKLAKARNEKEKKLLHEYWGRRDLR
jgi:hypothetical protein